MERVLWHRALESLGLVGILGLILSTSCETPEKVDSIVGGAGGSGGRGGTGGSVSAGTGGSGGGGQTADMGGASGGGGDVASGVDGGSWADVSSAMDGSTVIDAAPDRSPDAMPDVMQADVVAMPPPGVPRDAVLLFDESHDIWPEVTGTWSKFAADLVAQGHTIRTHRTGPLTGAALQGVEVLVIGTSWGSYTDAELQLIRAFVNDGGRLFVTGLGWSWVDPAKSRTLDNYPMNQVAQMFGIRILDGHLCDPTNNSGDMCKPVFIVSDLHPIMAGVRSVGGGLVPVALKAMNATVEVVMRGDADSFERNGAYTPGQRPPLIMATKFGMGQVIVMGSEGYFVNNDDDGDQVSNLDENDNRQLGRNIIQFLAGYR